MCRHGSCAPTCGSRLVSHVQAWQLCSHLWQPAQGQQALPPLVSKGGAVQVEQRQTGGVLAQQVDVLQPGQGVALQVQLCQAGHPLHRTQGTDMRLPLASERVGLALGGTALHSTHKTHQRFWIQPVGQQQGNHEAGHALWDSTQQPCLVHLRLISCPTGPALCGQIALQNPSRQSKPLCRPANWALQGSTEQHQDPASRLHLILRLAALLHKAQGMRYSCII